MRSEIWWRGVNISSCMILDWNTHLQKIIPDSIWNKDINYNIWQVWSIIRHLSCIYMLIKLNICPKYHMLISRMILFKTVLRYSHLLSVFHLKTAKTIICKPIYVIRIKIKIFLLFYLIYHRILQETYLIHLFLKT